MECYLSVGAGFARNTCIFLLAELLTSKGVVRRAGDEIHVQGAQRGHPEVVPVSLHQLQQFLCRILLEKKRINDTLKRKAENEKPSVEHDILGHS